jgi:hypothetical protein
MKVTLLQGTCTPTLTPMPGVHQAVHVTAARLRMLLNVNGLVWVAARDGGRYCDTRLRIVLLNVNRK